ncbi:MAG: RNA methyltransferase PUA domain-containing protein, partial [Pseudomonadota bacterium]
MAHIVRLFVDHPLSPGQSVPLGRDDAHRLGNVMRMQVGEELLLINGRDGEWRAEVRSLG